jgi:hypothetical protein
MAKNKTLKWIILLLVTLGAIAAVFFLKTDVSSAAGAIPLPSNDALGGLTDPDGEGLQKGYNLIWELAENYRYIIGSVAILFIVIAGVKLGLMGGNEEEAGKQKKNLYWGLVGLVFIMLAGPIAEILDMQNGGPLSDEYEIGYRAKLFDDQVHIVITFIKYIVGSVAVLFMIRSGAKLVIAGESDEVLNAEKKNLMMGVFALFVIMLSNTIVKEVLFKVDYSNAEYSAYGQEAVVEFDAARGVAEIVGITNFIVSWAAPFAVFALIIGAIMYLTAFGEQERMDKAKKIVINSVFALVIIYGSFAIVSTVISGVF